VLIKGMRPEAKICVVANRAGGVAGEVSRADFERGIGAKINHTVAFDPKAAVAAAESAKPFMEVVKAPKILAQLNELAAGLLGAEEPPPQTFLQRILGK
jgi:Flp pilus assembly CpaE family ATPase